MARMLHRRGKPADGSQKVFLAVAAYDGVSAGFAHALYHSGIALKVTGIESELAIYAGHCHVDDCRNRLLLDFLKSDCTDLVFLDADVMWRERDLVKLLGYDRDVVAGIYPKKHGDEEYPVKMLPGEIWADADGLIEVQGVPTGFLRIRRNVIDALAAGAIHYNARTDAKSAVPLIFERQVHDGVRFGGDYVFCRKWREAGGRIYIDPAMRFEHAGEATWTGSVGVWLKGRAGIGLENGLQAIREGRETPEDMVDLFESWNNPYAAAPAMLAALAMTARGVRGPILECGAGLSTLVMAVANPSAEVHVLEHGPHFAEHLRKEAEKYGLANIVIHCRPLDGGWYDIAGLPAHRWALIVIDGPPRKEAARDNILGRIDLTGSPLIVDDVHDGAMGPLMSQIQITHEAVFCGSSERQFAICAPREQVHEKAA